MNLSPLAQVISKNLSEFVWHVGAITCTFDSPVTRQTMIFNITFDELSAVSGVKTYDELSALLNNEKEMNYVCTVLADDVIKSERMVWVEENIAPFFAPVKPIQDKGEKQYIGAFDESIAPPTGTELLYVHSFEQRRGLVWSWENKDTPRYSVLAVYRWNEGIDERYLVNVFDCKNGAINPRPVSAMIFKEKPKCYECVFHYTR